MDQDPELARCLSQRSLTHPVLTAWWRGHLTEAHRVYTELRQQAIGALRDMPAVSDPSTVGELAALHVLAQE